ncbi:MAG: double-strand break repair helicase AddA [Beijerinckiaceae bacterium]|nr:double-strand break repair helicase AddA [Beijerinckiaceae bacterium]
MSAWTIPAHALQAQTNAANPQTSAWVSAHAGSGKTYVLAQRVIRLMLDGVAPSKILCLTFTKAAAANMALRVFDTLAKWTALSDGDLRAEIEKTGAALSDLAQARRLFARAVETPGGLKIQTIHAFCEKILHLFPFEANVAARFEVLTEEQQEDLMGRAREDVLGEAMRGEDLVLFSALNIVASLTTADTFGKLLRQALGQRRAIAAAGRRQQGEIRKALAAALGSVDKRSAVDIRADMIGGGIAQSAWEGLAALIDTGSANDKKCAKQIRRAIAAPDATKLDAWLLVFLTSKGEPRKTIVTGKFKSDAVLLESLTNEQERLISSLESLRVAEAVDRSEALTILAERIVTRYERLKQARGLLDFDNLIERTLALLSRGDAAQWVLFKLDAGVDHVLVDEAQDTSSEQWSILQHLTEEFFSGAGASKATRTFFAVGDEKQSIFSFQGANVDLFSEKRRAFQTKIGKAGERFEFVNLKLSFRSAKGLLGKVDGVFDALGHHVGVVSHGDPWLPHDALKETLPGLVEVWAPIEPTGKENPDTWQLPLDRQDASAPPQMLAERIADTIDGWLKPHSTQAVHDKKGDKRRVNAGDILILVRKRGPFFEAVIRALKEKGVPVAGADRLQLTSHLAVLDLIAAGEVALLARDDLTLACVLKSPFLNLTDDDLLELAPQRKGSLWRALRQSQKPEHQRAVARIVEWRRRAGDTPFQFYARILGAEGGRAALLARLGPEATDAADEFLRQALDSETVEAPSLVNFLHAMKNSEKSIKRDMEAAGQAVRVMTVHASKGLEAPIVFLPDTCSPPSGGHDPNIVALKDAHGEEIIAWRKGKNSDPQLLTAQLEQSRIAEEHEHRRLLYVAMTRAEERLYICGFKGRNALKDGCWHAMVSNALMGGLEQAPAPWNADEMVLRGGEAATLDAPAAPSIAAPASALPGWLLTPAPREKPPEPPISPSSALSAADQITEAGLDHAGADPLTQNGEGLRIGSLTHTLLQYLPDITSEARRSAALRFLAARAGDYDEAKRMALADRALAVIADPSLSALFGPGSRAEVNICARIKAFGAEIPMIGQIDRLAVDEDRVTIADFKSGVPRGADETPAGYIAQLALYRAAATQLWPGKSVRTVLVWTAGPRAVELAPDALDDALRSVARRFTSD